MGVQVAVGARVCVEGGRPGKRARKKLQAGSEEMKALSAAPLRQKGFPGLGLSRRTLSRVL